MKIIVVTSPCACKKNECVCDGTDSSERVAYLPCCSEMKRLLDPDTSVKIHAGFCGGKVGIFGRDDREGTLWTGAGGTVKHCPFCGAKIEQIDIASAKREAVTWVGSSEGWNIRLKEGVSIAEPKADPQPTRP